MAAPAVDQGTGQRSVVIFVTLLSVAAIAVAVAVAPMEAPADVNWWALPVLAGVLMAATWYVVPFRYGGSVDAVNLIEAALAPLLIAYPPIVVVVVAAASQVVEGILRQLSWVKTTFNAAMWALAAGLGALVIHGIGTDPVWPTAVVAMVAGLIVVGFVNNAAFSVVVALAERQPLRRMIRKFIPVAQMAWLGGWATNAAFGLLFALAFLATSFAAVLFFVPLIILHLAYRSYSAARADQARLAAAYTASAHLAVPLQPMVAVPAFLREVAECFDAVAAELVIRKEGGGHDIHKARRVDGSYTMRSEPEGSASLEGAIAATPGPVQLWADRPDPLSQALAATGGINCLAAPLLHGDRLIGALIVLDRGGFDGSAQGELAVLEALARETSGALAKGRLLADVLDEKRKLGEIVDTASDGILTLSRDGIVLTWNPALERITGFSADRVIGRGNLASLLHLRTADAKQVELADAPIASLPEDLFMTAADGGPRHLQCSYSVGGSRADSAALVMVARDVTPDDEHEALREEVSRLVEADAARRSVVEQLQHAVVPMPLTIPDSEIAAAYVASDPSSPTGGDLYDWQILPSGEVHIAVVDVLGHGVAATKDALAVVHTLRVVTASGTPLVEVVGKADELLRVQHPDLVATVIVARYDPSNGLLRVASGGHPPALIVTPRRQVRQVNALGGVIGWPGAGSDGVTETMLEPGDALILYTDGLVEARKNILDGIEELERHAAEVAHLDADELADELVERALAGADRRDDTLALVLRRSFARAREIRKSWSIAPEAAAASDLRRSLGGWLAERGIAADDAKLVAAELLANAVRAARTRVTLHAKVSDDELVLDVTDDGIAEPDIAQRGATLPAADAERGRGLYIVRALSTNVDVLTTEEMTMMRAILPVVIIETTPAPAPAPSTPSTATDSVLRRP